VLWDALVFVKTSPCFDLVHLCGSWSVVLVVVSKDVCGKNGWLEQKYSTLITLVLLSYS